MSKLPALGQPVAKTTLLAIRRVAVIPAIVEFEEGRAFIWEVHTHFWAYRFATLSGHVIGSEAYTASSEKQARRRVQQGASALGWTAR